MTLISLIRMLLGSWRLLLTTAVAGAALAAAVAYVTPPKYVAEVSVVPADEGPQMGGLSSMLGPLGGLASLAGINIGGAKGEHLGEHLALLKSRTFTMAFIRRHNLMPELFADDWNAKTRAWSMEDARDIPTDQDAFEEFDDNVRSLREDRKNGLYIIRVAWADREKAAEWANALVHDLNSEARTVAMREAQAQIEYLNAELAKTDVVSVRQAINNLLASQIQSIALMNARPDYAFRIVDPALVPDVDRYRWPLSGLMTIVGAVLGLLIGAITVVARARP